MAVTGIGGFFFRADDPTALAEWYLKHLGVGAPPGVFIWDQQAGPTVFAPFKFDSDYFAADKRWMLNLRVDDLDGLIASLKAAGIEVLTKAEWDAPEVGRFARIHDPEGNPIELWEPAAAAAA
ncbi:MAG: VOC family protein [Brevundimonas sp.]|uniref:VOC family protein n=1 Tax=Brevundimonas sp. TaxID=1871086 RepID=UPI002732513C|nr:VOC family protein [Brevundimonas sp.]MDP3377715.1 VOC family protein [Brevundimonas sp.]